MEDETDIGMMDRVKGFFKKKPLTPSNQVDQYITESLPDYIEEYNLAIRDDLNGVDKRIEEMDEEISNLKGWKEDTEKRLKEAKRKIKRLEKKEGLED